MKRSYIPESSRATRIKRVYSHPNPLFEKWLEEWKREAENRGSNMKYNYQKAIKSLRKFPLPLHSGRECLVLANFGEKICNLIDKKIEEHTNEVGPINWEDHIKVKQIKPKSVQKKRKVEVPSLKKPTSNKGSRSKQYIPTYRSGSYALLIALHRASESRSYQGFLSKQDLMVAAQDYCDASFTIPSEGSHYTAWSSMSTLIKKNLVLRKGNPSRYSLTSEGVALASLLESSDFPLTPPSSKSSQVKDSSVGSSSLSRVHDISSSDEEVINVGAPFFDPGELISLSDEEDYQSRKDSQNSQERDFLNSGLSENLLPAISSDEETVDENHQEKHIEEISLIEDDDEIENIQSFLEPPGVGDIPTLGLSENLLPAILSDEETVEENQEKHIEEISLIEDDDEKENIQSFLESPGVGDIPTLDLPSFTYVTKEGLETPLKENAYVSVDEDQGTLSFLIKAKLIDLFKSNLNYQLDETRNASPGFTYAFLNDSCAPDYCRESNTSNVSHRKREPTKPDTSCDKIEENIPVKRSKKNKNSFSQPPSIIPRQETVSQFKVSKIVDKESNSLATEEIISPIEPKSSVADSILFTLRPGTFKIVLNVDNTEVFGGASGSRPTKKIISEELKRHGIDFKVRNLKVGDFLWTCQSFTSSGEEREVVLPFIVERKRMDDLSQSIRDGRFNEQKFRLKQTGLSQLIYLVEEYGSSYISLPLSSCEQAITNTQIIDGFVTKITKDQKESAAYLTIMTRYLQSKFKNKTLQCVGRGSALLSNGNTSSSVVSLMSFQDLNSSGAKNRPLRLQDMFAKHLLQLNGASVNKVSTIVQKYKTPRQLIEALENVSTSSRENLLCDLRSSKSGRAIDQTVSAQVARLYTWENLS